MDIQMSQQRKIKTEITAVLSNSKKIDTKQIVFTYSRAYPLEFDETEAILASDLRF